MAEYITRYFSTDTLTIDNLFVDFEPLNIPVDNNITDVKVSDIEQDRVTISWTTKKPTLYKISFSNNLCPPEGCELTNQNYSTEHTKTIVGLQSNTEYTFKIEGVTSGAFVFNSPFVKFKTLQSIETPKPTSPPVLPAIDRSTIFTNYTWNIESNSIFQFNVGVNAETQYLKYYFRNQPDSDQDGKKTVSVANQFASFTLVNPNLVGIYELVIVPGNSTIGDGEEYRIQINVIKEKSFGTPDITQISFTNEIKEADLRPEEFDIKISADVINSEGVYLYLGEDLDNPIADLPVQNGKIYISYYGKDLLNSSVRAKINDTGDSYIFNFSITPYFNGLTEKILGKNESFTVKVIKTKYVISLNEALDKLSAPFSKLFTGEDTKKDYADKILFEDDKHLYYRVKYNNEIQDSFIITNIGKDDITYSVDGEKIVQTEFEINPETGNTERIQKTPYPTLVVKLLEPLPDNIEVNSLVWVSKQIIPTVVEDILITQNDVDECTPLYPNFSADVLDETGYEYFAELVGSGSNSTTNIVNTYLSSSKFSLSELNISYTSGSDVTSEEFCKFENFVNFSSAKTRIDNFQYKLESIEFYNQKISSSLYVGTTLSTSSLSLSTSQSYNNSINQIKNGFDGFEKTLYNNFSVTSSNSNFFLYQPTFADEYDRFNKNYIVRHLPSHIVDSEDNEEFILFVEMVAQHFDIIWSYIKGIEKSKKITNTSLDGIGDNLIYHTLQSLGWDPGVPFKSSELWKEAFGTNIDGSYSINTNQLGNTITPSFTIKDARNQIWRRILNNIPFLLKHKGTKRAINAIMSCYGVPSSLLTVMEFGGPGVRPESSSKYTYDDRTAAINVSETEYITVPWISSSTYVPTVVQTRFKTDYKIPYANSATGSQLIRKDRTGGGYWQVNLVPNFTSSFGNVIFTLKNATETETISLAITSSVLFDDYWKNITIQKERFVSNSINYDRFDLYVKEGLDDRIIMNQSASAIHTASAVTNIFTDVGNLYINGYNGTSGISGSFDEIRIWNTALSESVVTAHALNPDVIYGNGIYSSTNNLLLRLDFEYAKDRIADPYIKNVSPSIIFSGSNVVSGYIGYATASITTVATSYPYQYEIYERSVTAMIPSIGFVPNDKVRFEDIELVTDLSHKSRATKKAYDRAPIDSNRLGLFFSPVKELNLDILKSLGPINIGDYIGDWRDEYGTDTYKDLNSLRNYYFQRTNLSFEEYIKLIRSIDRSLFDMLKQVIPARAKYTKGLLLEPSVLERSKIKITKPTSEKIYYTSSIDSEQNILIEAESVKYDTTVQTETDKSLTGSLSNLSSSINSNEELNLFGEYINETGSILTSNEISLAGLITRNSGSSMGGIDITIDAKRTATIIGEYELELGYEAVGNEADSPFNLGFGLVGENGFVDRTYVRNDGTLVLTERKNAYLLTVKYTREIPSTNISGITTYEKVAKYKRKLVLVDSEILSGTTVQSATAHSFYTSISSALGTYPYDKGVVTEIYPFDGLTYGHYRFVGDLTKGLQNSFFEGAKQTSLTTIDGTPPVEVFVTNPNRLKVSDSGRGSGEPILEVD